MSPSGSRGCRPALNSSLVVYKRKWGGGGGGVSFVHYLRSLRSLSFTVENLVLLESVLIKNGIQSTV